MQKILLLIACVGLTSGAGAQSVLQRVTPQVKAYLQAKLQYMDASYHCAGEYTLYVTPKPQGSTVQDLLSAFTGKMDTELRQAAMKALQNGQSFTMQQSYAHMSDDRSFTMHLIYPDKHYGMYVENLGARYTTYSCKLK